MARKIVMVVMLAMAVGLVACGSSTSSTDNGGGGGDGGGSGTGLNNATSVTGTCRSSSSDPVPGTTVYLPGVTVSASVGVSKATRAFEKATTAADGATCEDPPTADSSLVAVCTSADGTFTLDTSAITSNPTQIVFQKGALRMVQNLSCSTAQCALDSALTTFGSSGGTTTWPTIAVVTGTFDDMEAVLAKLADSDTTDETNGQYGRVGSETGYFIYGSEHGTNMTIIDGTGYTYPEENTDTVTYNTWDNYLNGTYKLVQDGVPLFDVVFINCGTYYDSDIVANKVVIQDYVNAGGRLYVTDWAYNHVEQAFPQFMKYEGDPDDPNTPGALSAAKDGTGGLTLNAVVNNSGMTSWLDAVTVNSHDASTPGNPDDDCTYSSTYDQVTGALTADNLIPIGDFLGGWVLMIGAHTGHSPTIWISSGSGVAFDGLDNRPLTASMEMGSNSGKIIYSSYHTAHSCQTPYFWPQERVLQYLIFESF